MTQPFSSIVDAIKTLKAGKMVIEARFDWDQYSIDQFTHYYTHFVPDSLGKEK